MSHWAIGQQGLYPAISFYLSERRGPNYGRKRREWVSLKDAAIFPSRPAAVNAARQAIRYLDHAPEVYEVKVSVV